MAWIAAGCLIASLGIALGAIGAHLLKKTLSSDQLTLWETGVRYQMYASFGMIAAGLATLSPRRRNIVNFTMLAGIILFSGCLYAYAFSGVKTFVHIVPLGGFSMIAAWLWLAWFQFRFRGQHDGEEV
jgi:uncharacterized membrane protein YgdD (TMEM256/DUF423 family)